ncbi:MAG: ATP-binding cassette domain-containing protein, partial [Cyclobacteriaceae bacterium]|nr:ATP-binding cassette domain-containing protein [Cyclobacteriaceae bacterium]
MSEELLRAVIKLFAIVARERITDAERENISEFLLVHLNQESVGHYLRLFDKYVAEYKVEKKSGLDVDDETLVFVDEWSNIIKISKEVNKSLTITQKLILVIKIIELIYSGGEISERQENLMFYIAEALKLSKNQLDSLRGFVTGEDYEDLSTEDMLIIDEGSGQSAVAGPVMTAKNLTGIIAILRIPDIETYFIKYLGISTLYLNGIPFRSRTIDMFPTGSTIRGNKIKTIYYSDVINRFLMSEEMSRVTFSAEHIFYHFRSGKAGLQNIHFSEEGGKLIGLMGASGSGKSTLLNVLNGSERPSSGRVIINGVNVHDEPEKMEGVVGFVPQDDLLIAELTVFENLNFAAKLTFKDNTKEENAVLVGRILQSLGLSETAHLKVGSAFDKTISGGQRKRLNIALELLREPAVLFVDEPTSGLSSRDSENIMDLLKELSFKGKMIFVVIHQPSSDIFKMFDSLLILDAGGLEIYYGNPVEAVVYFKEIINAANKTQGGCPECGNINPEQVFDIIETRIVNEYGRLTQVRKVSPGQWYQYFKDNIKLPKIKHSREPLEVTQKIPGKLRQAGVFFHRDVKSKLSNKQYLAITLMEAPFLAFFMAYMVRYYATLNVDEPVYSFFK